MSCEMSLDVVVIKEEPTCEEHDDAAAKPEPGECSDTQLELEPGHHVVQVELVKVEPHYEEDDGSATGGAAAPCSDTQLAQESAGRLEGSLYPAHMTSSDALSRKTLLSDVYIKEERHCEEEVGQVCNIQIKVELEPEHTEQGLKDPLCPGHVVNQELVIGPGVCQQQAPAPLVSKEATIALESTSHHGCNHSGKSTSCDNCKKSKNTHKQVSCDTCGKKFSSKSILLVHQRIHTGEKLFKCDVCDKQFTQKGTLKIHRRVHSGEKSFKCDECGKQFTQKSTLKTHCRVHTGEKLYKCDECGKEFTQKGNLKTHRHVHIVATTTVESALHQLCKHSGASSPCDYCEKIKNIHKPVSCNICDKKFSYKSTLIVHQRIHTGNKLLECDICGKQFTQNSNLKTHRRVHSGEKPYTCMFCNKKYTQSSTLSRHMRVHSGEKSYTCSICNKNFTQRSNLNNHLRIHSGVKPYTCDFCNKKFARKSNLVRHLSRCSSEKCASPQHTPEGILGL